MAFVFVVTAERYFNNLGRIGVHPGTEQKVVRLKQEIACEDEAGALKHSSSPATVTYTIYTLEITNAFCVSTDRSIKVLARAYYYWVHLTIMYARSDWINVHAGDRGNPRARVPRQRVL